MASGRLYSAVTKRWPRIAAGLIVALGLIELVVGGLTADSGVEFYLMAWAGTTGGLWFLFDKAEQTLSDHGRSQIDTWIRTSDLKGSIESIPDQFGRLFDRVFGERHLSLKCFSRSFLTSVSVVLAASAGALLVNQLTVWDPMFIVWLVFVLNVIPDFISLIETRWMIRWMSRWKNSPSRFAALLGSDLLVTALISWSAYFAQNFGYNVVFVGGPLAESYAGAISVASEGFLDAFVYDLGDGTGMPGPAIFFYSAFFTSAWLWLYAASVLVSRALLRMNSGVGFLLRVTDVERQPFRSMGFVSVIIVSALFALGLPLVLL